MKLLALSFCLIIVVAIIKVYFILKELDDFQSRIEEREAHNISNLYSLKDKK